jgi:hypothetical protein
MWILIYILAGMIGVGAFIVKTEGEITAASALLILGGWVAGPFFLLVFLIEYLSKVVIWRRK